MLEPELDAYGILARESSLADLIELQALSGQSLSREELADFARDSSWHRRLSEQIRVPDWYRSALNSIELYDDDEDGDGELSAEIDRSEEFAGRVFAQIDQRRRVLGDDYPFSETDGRLFYRGRGDLAEPYLVLLGICIVHAYSLSISFDVKQYFEDYVTRALTHRGLLAVNLARVRRGTRSLSAALESAGAECGLRPTPERGIIRYAAQEEGVDIIAHLSWDDLRPLHWVYVVQATCARSDEWRKKLKEPSPEMWRDLLGLHSVPRAILAVPHHVPDNTLAFLAGQDSTRLILDRLRLCSLSSPLEAEDVEITRTLAAIGVRFL